MSGIAVISMLHSNSRQRRIGLRSVLSQQQLGYLRSVLLYLQQNRILLCSQCYRGHHVAFASCRHRRVLLQPITTCNVVMVSWRGTTSLECGLLLLLRTFGRWEQDTQTLSQTKLLYNGNVMRDSAVSCVQRTAQTDFIKIWWWHMHSDAASEANDDTKNHFFQIEVMGWADGIATMKYELPVNCMLTFSKVRMRLSLHYTSLRRLL